MREGRINIPHIGQTVLCTVEFWRYGCMHHTEKIIATYLGMNNIIGEPMFDIETYDEAYAHVIKWEQLQKEKA
jgi:hypothetical protein